MRDKRELKYFFNNHLKDEEYYECLREGYNVFGDETFVSVQYKKNTADIIVYGVLGWLNRLAHWGKEAGVWHLIQKKIKNYDKNAADKYRKGC